MTALILSMAVGLYGGLLHWRWRAPWELETGLGSWVGKGTGHRDFVVGYVTCSEGFKRVNRSLNDSKTQKPRSCSQEVTRLDA